LKELEDYSWFPSLLRKFQTEFIGFVVTRFNVYNGFINHLTRLSLPGQPLTDLCSGSGEPAIHIFRKSSCFTHLFLSDKYPGSQVVKSGEDSYALARKDVLEMEFNPGTCYSMFNAFHHFSKEDQLKIVRKLHHSGSTAFLAEILEPDVICFLKVLFTTTIGCLLLTPFIRPFSFRRLFFTYLLPVNILTITYDGLVSVMKSRTANQYRKILANQGEGIEVIRLRNGLSPIIVIQIHAVK
jgi:hypothetical protein